MVVLVMRSDDLQWFELRSNVKGSVGQQEAVECAAEGRMVGRSGQRLVESE